ncbi:MAG TPA: asparagine synthase C-terminal domain-containing protein [Bacteroidales bacterium]|nr:asparagine synthase C-terminal domain-containing protein [Bacteroidales bacterium]
MESVVKIITNDFSWRKGRNLYVAGHAHSPGGEFMNEDALLNYFSQMTDNPEKPVRELTSLNGIYSFIYSSGNTIYLYCDKSRFFPVFFRISPQIAISDDPEELRLPGDSISEDVSAEFRHMGYTTGPDTLIDEIKQVPPGELVTIRNGKIERERIFSFKVKPGEISHDGDPVAAMHKAIEGAALRFIRSIGKSTPVLPLSGGFDSRLIACILKNYGYDNTICFTYGRRTREVDISQKVAELLGFKWYFVDYEKFQDEALSISSKEFYDYYRYASKFTSMFYLQEYPAVLYLLKHKLIPDESVFLPGHSGDLLGGSQFGKVFPVDIKPNKVLTRILKSKYFNYPDNFQVLKIFRKRLDAELDAKSAFLGYSIFEDWDIREKIAKFIINSSHVFSFFGFQVRFFYWDNELVDFFRKLPPECKNHKHIYDSCLRENYFKKYSLNFEKELTPGRFTKKLQKIKNRLKPLLPRSVRYRYILKNDWACYEKLTGPMLADINPSIRKKLPYNGFNSVIINWYLAQLNKNESPDNLVKS